MIEEILWTIWMDLNNITISTNTKISIKVDASNNRIIIKESFAVYLGSADNLAMCNVM